MLRVHRSFLFFTHPDTTAIRLPLVQFTAGTPLWQMRGLATFLPGV